ncbi:MAG: DUF4920 domain-containing protein [Desulfobulbaceae bacterium]|nr:DUF4920 domain-containing protein [Desulfobulbaceae bacterium]
MKKIIFALVLLIFSSATSLLAFEGDKFGKPLTLTEPTKVSEIEKSPQAFVGKRVLISGTVVEVCSTRGCWLDIASDTPFEKIQAKVTDGVIVFPMSARGRTAYVEGVVEELKFSKKDALKYQRHKAREKGIPFDPATVTGPQTIYRLRAHGAVIEK